MFNNVNIISSTTTWSLVAAGFVNPSYISSLVGGPDQNDANGFDITGAGGLVIAFEGTYTGQTVSHQQTLDPTGAAGWFTVSGVPANGGTGSTSGSTSGIAYVFPVAGVRHRIQVTALSTGTIVVRVATTAGELATSTASGGGGGSLTAVANAAAPSQSEGASVSLSTDLHTGLRVLNMGTDGTPLDPTLPSPVKGSIASGSAASDPPVMSGVRGNTTNPTAVTDGQVAYMRSDKLGRANTVPFQVRDLCGRSAVVTLTTTGETTLIAQVASTFNDIVSIKLANTSATAVRVDVRDTTGGTVIDTWYLPAGDTRGAVYSSPLKQTTVNTNWTVQLSGAVTDVRIVAQYVQNT